MVVQERDVDNVPRAVPLLKQAACLGEYDAMYMLSVILNNGFKVKADEIQVRKSVGSVLALYLPCLKEGRKCFI